MIAKVVPSRRDPKQYTVEIIQGIQSFRLEYTSTEPMCEWYAGMFRIAIEASKKEGPSKNKNRAKRNGQQ